MRKEKQLLLNDIKGQLNQFNTFVIMQYFGLSANLAHDFRMAVAKTGGEVEVVPKRVLSKAAADLGIELDPTSLQGHIGLVFAGEDPVETTKIIFEFSKESNKAIGVVGGRFDGKLYSAEDVEKLSKLPSMDQMRAQLLSVFVAPMRQTLAAMDAVLTSVIYCLDNRAKQMEA